MDNIEQDIIAVLLKIVYEHDLIPEPTYRAALNKLFCTIDACDIIEKKGAHRHGHPKSTR